MKKSLAIAASLAVCGGSLLVPNLTHASTASTTPIIGVSSVTVTATGIATTTIPLYTHPLAVRDLMLGISGEDVRALQLLLVRTESGPKAQALSASMTANPGYFDANTKAALAEYQVRYHIAPAAGYFGRITRGQMKSYGVPYLWW
jgi:hypothetical protein